MYFWYTYMYKPSSSISFIFYQLLHHFILIFQLSLFRFSFGGGGRRGEGGCCCCLVWRGWEIYTHLKTSAAQFFFSFWASHSVLSAIFIRKEVMDFLYQPLPPPTNTGHDLMVMQLCQIHHRHHKQGKVCTKHTGLNQSGSLTGTSQDPCFSLTSGASLTQVTEQRFIKMVYYYHCCFSKLLLNY